MGKSKGCQINRWENVNLSVFLLFFSWCCGFRWCRSVTAPLFTLSQRSTKNPRNKLEKSCLEWWVEKPEHQSNTKREVEVKMIQMSNLPFSNYVVAINICICRSGRSPVWTVDFWSWLPFFSFASLSSWDSHFLSFHLWKFSHFILSFTFTNLAC